MSNDIKRLAILTWLWMTNSKLDLALKLAKAHEDIEDITEERDKFFDQLQYLQPAKYNNNRRKRTDDWGDNEG